MGAVLPALVLFGVFTLIVKTVLSSMLSRLPWGKILLVVGGLVLLGVLPLPFLSTVLFHGLVAACIGLSKLFMGVMTAALGGSASAGAAGATTATTSAAGASASAAASAMGASATPAIGTGLLSGAAAHALAGSLVP